MKARIKWIDGVSFVGEAGSGHSVVIDVAPEQGGRNIGVRPMELVLIGMAACSAVDVVQILKKARQPIADCVVEAGRSAHPRCRGSSPSIHLAYTVAGRGLDARQVERAVTLSKDKYCSATQMLAKTAAVTYDITLVEGDSVPPPAA